MRFAVGLLRPEDATAGVFGDCLGVVLTTVACSGDVRGKWDATAAARSLGDGDVIAWGAGVALGWYRRSHTLTPLDGV